MIKLIFVLHTRLLLKASKYYSMLQQIRPIFMLIFFSVFNPFICVLTVRLVFWRLQKQHVRNLTLTVINFWNKSRTRLRRGGFTGKYSFLKMLLIIVISHFIHFHNPVIQYILCLSIWPALQLESVDCSSLFIIEFSLKEVWTLFLDLM